MACRTVKFSRKQLNEIVGDFMKSGDDSNSYDNNKNVSTNGKLSNGDEGKPVTTDEIGQQLTQQGLFGLAQAPYGNYTKRYY